MMKKMILFALILYVLLTIPASATIIHVPGQYSTIQEGINASVDGDTVLVSPGVYFETVIVDGKNIVLASMFLTSGDSSYITNTIIDGNETTRPITIIGAVDTTMALIGFTIQNGHIDNGGGIGCSQSNPKITNNVIQNNRCSVYGGGIFCAQASPIIDCNAIISNMVDPGVINEGGGISCFMNSHPRITNNIIEGNTASVGGGIICVSSSDPVISYNTIACNQADSGAGIFCRASSPTIENNIIVGDSAGAYGGGIYLNLSNPVIRGNTIKGNHAWTYGGGIYGTGNSVIELHHNSIFDNGVLMYGGAIYCNQCTLTVFNNTLHGNYAAWGSGMALYSSSFTISNSIFARHLNGVAIGISLPGEQEISFCDFHDNLEGNFGGACPPGIGELNSTNHNGDSCDTYSNIYIEPLFVDPGHGYFQLNWGSPCIDAGLPDSLDPDGTISDMGAFYFQQDMIVVAMIPDTLPVTVPAGGSFSFTGVLQNLTGIRLIGDVWIMLRLPGGATYGPLQRFDNIPLSPHDTIIVNNVTQSVPLIAPLGFYDYVAYSGRSPNLIADSAFFGFDVTAPMEGGADDWNLSRWFEGTEDETPAVPTTFVLFPNYPNPFNSNTTINYQLPVNCEVKVVVYNLLGQIVETLADGRVEAGHHQIQWDASSYSSGIYFYRLAVGDRVFTKRMTLIK
jgi:hypothetical protein